MNTINKFLIAIIVILVAVIGYEGYIIYSESYAISNIKPYTDPYKSYSKDKLETMMEKGDLDATAEYGIRLIDEDNDKDGGFKLCMKAATTGNARGENAVGCYYNDMKDYNEALKWFNKAAEKNCLYAISNLGSCYAIGKGVKEDKGKAFSLFKEAAMKGFGHTQGIVGCCYISGDGVRKNDRVAVRWFKKAAESGNVDSYIYLAACYENGFGVKKNECTAAAWYAVAANNGNALGMCRLGDCYADGIGVRKDEKRARQLYLKAAELGNEYAKEKIRN